MSDSDPAKVRIACVDDDTLIREGLAHLLPQVEVVGTYPRVEDLLADRPAADVALVDLWLRAPEGEPVHAHGMHGVHAVAQAGYRVLIYTNERRRHVLAGCLAAGASGIVHKSEPLPALREAVAAVASGGVVITTALAGLVEVVDRRGRIGRLSPRQIEVLRARARGESYRSIGARLFISPKTAEEYMAEVTRRFSAYLLEHSAADLERLLGVGPGDLLDPN
ncbi:response regulator transcription factor [Pedococcus sp. KACC 23699]|uniref:Response regulator transcription factor n=1 Tax=Pedococcus sp. KACC 23699 TaxID=3149228 RepID=A0AAU7JY10_9MICO